MSFSAEFLASPEFQWGGGTRLKNLYKFARKFKNSLKVYKIFSKHLKIG